MPRIKLSQHSINRLKAPDPSGRQVHYWDLATPGFGVRVSGTTNQMSFVVQRDMPSGKSVRVTIAAVGEVSLESAREQAREKIQEMRQGIDPKAARLGKGTQTLKGMLDLYLERHPLSEKSKRDYSSSMQLHLGDWLDFSLATISSDMVEQRYHSLAEEKGAATANLCMRVFRAVYNYAAGRDHSMPPNPTRLLRRQWKKVQRRSTLVGAARLARFYKAVNALPNKIQRDYLLFVLFTGLRRTAAASLTWEQIDFTEKVIRIPWQRTKHKAGEFKLPMSDFVCSLLQGMETRSEGGFVFPANSSSGHISEPKHPLGLVAEASGIDVSIHDLRRDFITAAESTEMSAFVMKALVDHTLPMNSGDVTGGYVDMPVGRLREPAQRVCDLLKEWCGLK